MRGGAVRRVPHVPRRRGRSVLRGGTPWSIPPSCTCSECLRPLVLASADVSVVCVLAEAVQLAYLAVEGRCVVPALRLLGVPHAIVALGLRGLPCGGGGIIVVVVLRVVIGAIALRVGWRRITSAVVGGERILGIGVTLQEEKIQEIVLYKKSTLQTLLRQKEVDNQVLLPKPH